MLDGFAVTSLCDNSHSNLLRWKLTEAQETLLEHSLTHISIPIGEIFSMMNPDNRDWGVNKLYIPASEPCMDKRTKMAVNFAIWINFRNGSKFKRAFERQAASVVYFERLMKNKGALFKFLQPHNDWFSITEEKKKPSRIRCKTCQ